MPSRRRGPSRQQLSRSALPSIQTLVGGGCGNGTGLRNRNGNAIGLPVPPTTALITPGPVRHCQIPDLPVDGSLFFEFLFFIYLLIVLFIQYINIYKTVWWYPYNHPASCTSLNFHLIDYYLAAFITVMLARRLVWALISEATKAGAASTVHYTALILARLVLLTLCGWVLCWTLVNLFRSHSVLNLLFLGYPKLHRTVLKSCSFVNLWVRLQQTKMDGERTNHPPFGTQPPCTARSTMVIEHFTFFHPSQPWLIIEWWALPRHVTCLWYHLRFASGAQKTSCGKCGMLTFYRKQQLQIKPRDYDLWNSLPEGDVEKLPLRNRRAWKTPEVTTRCHHQMPPPDATAAPQKSVFPSPLRSVSSYPETSLF